MPEESQSHVPWRKKQKCHMHIDVGEKYHPAKLKDDVKNGPYRAIQSSHHPHLHHSTIASHLSSSKSPKSLGLDTKTRPPAHPRHLSAKMNASKSATISAQRCNDLSAATGARPKAAATVSTRRFIQESCGLSRNLRYKIIQIYLIIFGCVTICYHLV